MKTARWRRGGWRNKTRDVCGSRVRQALKRPGRYFGRCSLPWTEVPPEESLGWREAQSLWRGSSGIDMELCAW